MTNRVVGRAARAVRVESCGVAAVGAIIVAAMAMPSDTQAANVFARNLIVNPGAEAGPGATTTSGVVSCPGWSTSGNFTAVAYGTMNLPSLGTPGPTNRGVNFFAGGPGFALSSATQAIDLSDGAGVIASGHSTFVFSGWLGGSTQQDDSMILSLTFNDSAGESLATVTLNGPTSAARNGLTSFLFRSRSGPVPAGTRSVNIAMISSPTVPSYNDGYADNLGLVLVNPCVADVDNGSSTGMPDGGVGIEDLLYYLGLYNEGVLAADVDDGSGTGTHDGGVGIEDLLYYLVRYNAGC